jgi:hypothetical protein
MVTSYSLPSRDVQFRLKFGVLEFYWELLTKIWMFSARFISLYTEYFIIMALRLEVSLCSVKKKVSCAMYGR